MNILKYGNNILNNKVKIQSMWRKEVWYDSLMLLKRSIFNFGSSLLYEQEQLQSYDIQLPFQFRDKNFKKLCSKGCDVPEILNHIVQQCHTMHFHRIERNGIQLCSSNSVIHCRKGSSCGSWFTPYMWIWYMRSRLGSMPDLVTYTSEQVIVIKWLMISYILTQLIEIRAWNMNTSYVPVYNPYDPRRDVFTSFTTNWREWHQFQWMTFYYLVN